jgi:hypothetical protein
MLLQVLAVRAAGQAVLAGSHQQVQPVQQHLLQLQRWLSQMLQDLQAEYEEVQQDVQAHCAASTRHTSTQGCSEEAQSLVGMHKPVMCIVNNSMYR